MITGSSTNKNVSFSGLVTNAAYTAVITVTDANGITASSTVKFDTFIPSLVWEAEDFDFSGGQFIDNPVLSSSARQAAISGRSATRELMSTTPSTPAPRIYRSGDAMSTDVAGDVPRQNFLDAIAVDPAKLGTTRSGISSPMNGSTTPAPIRPAHSISMRGWPKGLETPGRPRLSLVTSGWATSSQATTLLGRFSFLGTGWQTYSYVPLRDILATLPSSIWRAPTRCA